jgi:hypothetical protein
MSKNAYIERECDIMTNNGRQEDVVWLRSRF